MANMMDYIDWRGDLSFSEAPINEVDTLILSQICYVDFENIVSSSFNKPIMLSSAVKTYLRRHKGEPAYLGAIVPSEIIALMSKAAYSKRFSSVRICGYVNIICDDREMQFSAMTFLINESLAFVAYRGTDDTIIGWKEDFNMSFMHPVPAQTEAVSYLEAAAATRREKFYLGGHSKGGNLAVYALTKCSPEAKARVLEAYNHDGPGFSREFIDSPQYDSVRSRIRSIVPQSSVVGMLLEHEEKYDVIKSTQNGIMQHDSFSWEVMGGSFIHLDTVTKESKFIDRTVKQWLSELSPEERESFVDKLYEALCSTNAKTLTELNADKKSLVKAISGLDEETRSVAMKYIKLIFAEKLQLKKK